MKTPEAVPPPLPDLGGYLSDLNELMAAVVGHKGYDDKTANALATQAHELAKALAGPEQSLVPPLLQRGSIIPPLPG